MTERVVTLIDMDCFYCQVEAREDTSLRGKPSAVVQYNTWKGGGIIAVNYEARAMGVTRNMRGDDAKQKCPDIVLVKVPEVRGKADLTKYRSAGKEVIQVLLEFGGIVERASVDEAYVDLTSLVENRMNENFTAETIVEHLRNTFVVGHDAEDTEREIGLKLWLQKVFDNQHDPSYQDDLRLAVGAMIVEEMRARVFEKTQFRCSAGIAHNKTMAKFACGIHKPNKQTILPQCQIQNLFRKIKVTKLRGLGGKLGDAVEEELNCKMLSDLAALSFREIRDHFDEKTANWLYNIAKGICNEPVKERDLPKSIGCSKNFRGPEMLATREKVEFWVRSLCEEVAERLGRDREDNNRQARGLHVSISSESKGTISRAGPLHSYEVDKMTRQALHLIAKSNEAPSSDKITWKPKLRNISISAGKFEELSQSANQSIMSFFGKRSLAIAPKNIPPETDANSTVTENFNRETLVETPVAEKKNFFGSKKHSAVADYNATEEKSDIEAEKPKRKNFFASNKSDESKPLLDDARENFNSADSSSRRRFSGSDDAEDVVVVKTEQNVENDSITAEELVPSLNEFDRNILDLLPQPLRQKVEQRVKLLEDEVASLYDPPVSNLTDDLETCEKCGRRISPFELPEHLDFHVAQDLQLEMKKEPLPVRTVFVSDKSTKAQHKRKSNLTENSSTNPPKRQRDISSFFTLKTNR